MKNLFFLSIIFIQLQTLSFGQTEFWNIKGHTTAENIQILDELADGKGLVKGDQIFAKAKGFFSFSPINSINNRAISKLKTEASLKGASHIFINYRSIENSWFSKTSLYSALIFKQDPISVQEISQAINGKKLILKVEKRYSRNDWKASEKEIQETIDLGLNEPLIERNGKILIKLKSKESNSAKYSKEDYYEVIAFEGNKLLILREFKKDTSFLLCAIEIR